MTSGASRVVVAGAGIAGLTLALALKRGAGEALAVTVCDPEPPGGTAKRDLRASAIAAASRRMLCELDVWPMVAGSAQPIREMVITDSRLADPVRQPFLTFDGEIGDGEPFAHMVENEVLAGALRSACGRAGIDFAQARIERFTAGLGRATVRLRDGRELKAELVVAADGARSLVRQMAGIAWIGYAYDQAGIVATVTHERAHQGRAVQHFLPSGPFAILPLTGHRCSIVWTERAEAAAALIALDDDDLTAELERRFGLELGAVSFSERPRAFPLSLGIARRFVGERLALIGDAAHVIHPLAGLGLNLGLRDVAALAEAVIDDVRLGLPPGEAGALQRYERARRFDTVVLGATTDGLNRLFSNDFLPVRLARDLGLGLVDRVPGLKAFFMREAAGVVGAVPRLMRGERL